MSHFLRDLRSDCRPAMTFQTFLRFGFLLPTGRPVPHFVLTQIDSVLAHFGMVFRNR